VVMREIRPKNGYNVEKAARFYKETVEWRERFWMEHTLRYPPGKLELVNMLVPELNFGCYDREGHPVYFLHFGLASGKQVLNRISAQEWALCHAYGLDMMELMCRQQTAKLGKWVDKMRVVVDFEGVSIFAIRDFIPHAKRCAHMDTTYYTGLMLSTYLINVPQSLSWATALFWPFMSAGVKRKIKIYTTGYEEDLLKVIPAESLPVKYGGKREWETIHANKIDWKTYDFRVRKAARKNFELKRIILDTRQKHQLSLRCRAGTQVKYYFETDKTALKFACLFYKKGQKTAVHLIEESTRKSNIVPENSHVSIFEEGTVVLVWKNDYGWSTKKQRLLLGLKVIPIDVPESDGKLGHLKLIT